MIEVDRLFSHLDFAMLEWTRGSTNDGLDRDECWYSSPQLESQAIMKSKKILVWGCEDILNSSIKLFLSAKEDWQVISITDKESLKSLNLAVETSHPDIVIIQQSYQNSSNKLPLQILQEHPTIKVITISLENNLMEIFSKQKLLVKQASDLIAVIENEA